MIIMIRHHNTFFIAVFLKILNSTVTESKIKLT